MKQRDIFLSSEGDRYFARNPLSRERLAEYARSDPVLQILRARELQSRNALEVGAASGWRLALMREAGMLEFSVALDPSMDALRAGREEFSEVRHLQGTADRLPFRDASFDLLIYGFCLYLCDREDLPRIVSEAARILPTGGYLAVFDFHQEQPCTRSYEHAEGVFSFKMDYSALFMDSAAFAMVEQAIMPYPQDDLARPSSDELAVSLLRRKEGNHS